MAKSEDPDEMQHKAAFHQGLHYLLRQNWFSEKEIYIGSYMSAHGLLNLLNELRKRD